MFYRLYRVLSEGHVIEIILSSVFQMELISEFYHQNQITEMMKKNHLLI